MNARNVAGFIAAGRVGLGLGLLLAPASFGRGWIGPDATRPGGKTAVRATGARDVALGLGALLAIRRGRPVRGWVEASIVADAADALAVLAAFGGLPPAGRLVTLATAAGSALVSSRLARAVDAPASLDG